MLAEYGGWYKAATVDRLVKEFYQVYVNEIFYKRLYFSTCLSHLLC